MKLERVHRVISATLGGASPARGKLDVPARGKAAHYPRGRSAREHWVHGGADGGGADAQP